MAIENTYLNGEGVQLGTSHFDLQAQKPLDSRARVATYAGLQALIDGKAAYDGMIVYVEEDQKTYQAKLDDSNVLKFEDFFITSEKIAEMVREITAEQIEFSGVTANLPTVATDKEQASRGNMYKASAKFFLKNSQNADPNANGTDTKEGETESGLWVKVGDAIIYEGNGKWWHIPSGDVDSWRPIKVYETGEENEVPVEINANAELKLKAGENVNLDATKDGTVVINAVDTDTHHVAHLIFGDQEIDTACENADTSTGALYMNLVEDGEIRDTHKIAVANDTPMVITHSKDDATLTFEILENSKDDNGYVKASNGQANKVWKTDENGNPDWRDDDNDNTTYTGTDKIIVDDTVIKHEKLAEAATGTKEEGYKSTFVTGATVDEYGHVTGYTTADVYIPDVTLDGKSIDKNDDTTPAIEIKGFKKAANLTLPQKNANGEISWITIDKAIEGATENTVTTGDAGNINNPGQGSIVHKETEIGYEVSIKGADKATAGQVLKAKGNGDVEWAADNDTQYTLVVADEGNNYNNSSAYSNSQQGGTLFLNLAEEGGPVVSSISVEVNKGKTNQPLTLTSDGRGDIVLDINNIKITSEQDKTISQDGTEPDIISVVTNIERTEDTVIDLTQSKYAVPTKAYVDRLVSGATSYLGTVANEAQLKALNPGKGDFVRVSAAFGEYHASDMLICETPKTEGADATWSLIHGEIDTDTNTWELNTKTADGYVKKGEGHANQVWKTDADGNPDWRDEQDISGKMDIVAEAAKGHYAVFGDNGQVVDGGYIYANAINCSDDKATGVQWAINEHSNANIPDNSFDNPVLDIVMRANNADGIKIDAISITHPDTEQNGGVATDRTENLGFNIGLTDAAKASLAKADTAIQEITANCKNEEEDHANLNCTTSGLKVTRNKDDNGEDIPGSINVEIDDSITFIFNCGGAADCI